MGPGGLGVWGLLGVLWGFGVCRDILGSGGGDFGVWRGFLVGGVSWGRRSLGLGS